MINPLIEFSALQEGYFGKDKVHLVRMTGHWLDRKFQATMLHATFHFDPMRNLFELQRQIRAGIARSWRWRMRNSRWKTVARRKVAA